MLWFYFPGKEAGGQTWSDWYVSQTTILRFTENRAQLDFLPDSVFRVHSTLDLDEQYFRLLVADEDSPGYFYSVVRGPDTSTRNPFRSSVNHEFVKSSTFNPGSDLQSRIPSDYRGRPPFLQLNDYMLSLATYRKNNIVKYGLISSKVKDDTVVLDLIDTFSYSGGLNGIFLNGSKKDSYRFIWPYGKEVFNIVELNGLGKIRRRWRYQLKDTLSGDHQLFKL